MAAPTAGSTPFVPLGNEVSGPLTDPGTTALDNYEAWYMNMHGEASNKWFMGRNSGASAAPWPAAKIAARGVWTSSYRHGTFSTQANSDDPGVSPTNPLGGIAATADAAADTLTVTGTWSANGERFVIGANTVPGGLSLTEIYYVVNRSVAGGQTTFKAALTSGGAAINITSAGTSVRVAELQPTWGEARFAEQQIPLSIAVWWPGNYNASADGGGGTNGCLSAAVSTAPAQGTAGTITVNRIPEVELPPVGAVPGTSTDLRRRTWPYGRLTDAASVVVSPCYTFGENSTGAGDNRFVDWVRIDDEIMQIRAEPTEVSGIISIPVWRGAFGTTTATHSSGAKVLAPAYIGSTSAGFNDSTYSGCPHRNDWTFTLRYGLRTIDAACQDFMAAQTVLARCFDTDLQGHSAIWLDIGGPSMYNVGSKWANPVSYFDTARDGRVSVSTGTWNTQNYAYWQRGKYQGWQQRFPGIRMYTNCVDDNQTADSDKNVGRVYQGGIAETFLNLDTMSDAFWRGWMETIFHCITLNWPVTWWVRRVNLDAPSTDGDRYAKLCYASMLLAFNKRFYRSSRAITAATRVGQVATFTVGSTSDLTSGDWVAIRGVTPQAYNCFQRITVTSGTTFQMTLPSVPSGAGSAFGTAEGKPPWEFMERWNESQPEGLYFFDLGTPIGSPDDVTDLDQPVSGLYRRDYSKAIVLVNPSSSGKNFTLPSNATWYDVTLNGGTSVDSGVVTVPLKDSKVYVMDTGSSRTVSKGAGW